MANLEFDSASDALAVAHAARERGDIGRAAEIFRRLPVIFPSKENALAAADGLQSCGLRADAVTLLEEALTAYPVGPALLIRLAEEHGVAGNYARATAYLQRHLDHDPSDLGPWKLVAHYHALAHDWADAEKALRHILAASPTDVAVVLGLGDVLFQSGRAGEAFEMYRRASVTQPSGADAFFKLGSMLLQRGDYDGAEANLWRAVENGSQDPSAHANYALALYGNGKLHDAVAAARRGLVIDATSPSSLFALGTGLNALGEFELAAAALRNAAATAPQNVSILSALATAEASLGNAPAALRALESALASEPHDLQVQHMLAALLGAELKTTPPGYARQVFDECALRYDYLQTRVLGNRASADLADYIEELQPDRESFGKLLDLGCGTGLTAEALSDAFRTDTMVGVDVAPRMLAIARAKGIYSRLVERDAIESLGVLDESFDLVTAVDLLPYLGELSALFPALHPRLQPGGLFACSIEISNSLAYGLAQSGRFFHSIGYIKDLAQAAGLRLLAARPNPLGREYRKPIEGALLVLERPR